MRSWLYPPPVGRAADLPSRRPRRDRLQCPSRQIDSQSPAGQRCENLIRPIALTRKNALFAGHDEGGRAWGRIASLIATAKINGVEPFAYLKDTLEAIAAGHPASRLDELLPWNFQPSS
ncbi:transposase domain-containing protein [Leisingera sp. M527]|uniref:transposase domain-containing protein n=1 Tax=Leisingera sp. M527 TaxID=2867014 RepID=UPI0038FCBBE1